MSIISKICEHSWTDMLAAIEQAPDLPEQIKRHWACSVRQIAQYLDRPLEGIPARFKAVQTPLKRVHHARLGIAPKTLANHKANVTGALRWFAKEKDIPQYGVPLTADWAAFRDAIEDRPLRHRLASLMRYCSARGLGPNSVADKIFDEYWRYRAETTSMASDDSTRRLIARTWNACAAIDGRTLPLLSEPPLKPPGACPAWDDFPEGPPPRI